MEKFFLEAPSLNRKNEIIEYLDEYVQYNSDFNGCDGLIKIYYGYSFEQALERTIKMQDEKYARINASNPWKTLLLIRESDKRIVGSICIRWNIPEEKQKFASYIGYGIRPTERRNGYSKINLYLGLLEIQKLGLKEITIACDSQNIASEKTMQALGGILMRQEVDPTDGVLTTVYSFAVDECLAHFKAQYANLIAN